MTTPMYCIHSDKKGSQISDLNCRNGPGQAHYLFTFSKKKKQKQNKQKKKHERHVCVCVGYNNSKSPSSAPISMITRAPNAALTVHQIQDFSKQDYNTLI